MDDTELLDKYIHVASKLAHCMYCHRHDMLAGECITWEDRDDEALSLYKELTNNTPERMDTTNREELERLKKELALWKANHDNMVKLNQMLRDRPDLGERATTVDALVSENRELKTLLQEARLEALKWQDAWVEEKSLEDMGNTVFSWQKRAMVEHHWKL